MRFRGTLILLLICAALGGYLYFYEIKGGEQRARAKQEENRLWKLESADVQQLDLTFAGEHITATRIGDKDWKIAAPRVLEADSEEIERLASSGAALNRETTVETGATDLARLNSKPRTAKPTKYCSAPITRPEAPPMPPFQKRGTCSWSPSQPPILSTRDWTS
jgi:hypothetical protein